MFHISFRFLVRRQMMMSAIDVDVYYLLHFEGIQRDGWKVDVSKVLIWKACGTSGAADPWTFHRMCNNCGYGFWFFSPPLYFLMIIFINSFSLDANSSPRNL